jgi:ribonuclease HI
MVDLIRIWLETDNQPAFRSAGWAYVLAEGRAISGAAGGERTISADRAALAGLVDALRAAPSGANVEVRSSAAAVASIQRRLMAASDDAPTEDLELWAQILTALKSRTVRFTAAAPAPRTPTAFAAAWAELARNKAKTAGVFRSAIPKPNLAKAGVPA